MSLDLLTILAERENNSRWMQFVKQGIINAETYQILLDAEVYFQHHPHIMKIDWEAFADWFSIVQHPGYPVEKHEKYAKIFKLCTVHTLTDSGETIVQKLLSMDYCAKIAEIALSGAEGEPVDIADIEELIANYDTDSGRVNNLDDWFVMEDIDTIATKVVAGGLEWRMDFLNRSIGNLRKGKLITFAARPGTGKTTFLAAEATFMAPQLEDDEYVIWFNNEEEGSAVKFRVVQAALGKDAEYIYGDPKRALTEYEKAIIHKQKILIVDKPDLSIKDMEEVLRTRKAGLIIVDQLWKVHGYEKTSANETARLGHVFQWARELSKKHAPLLTVHQVKAEGEGVEYLTPNLLYMSGTVIQGEVDSLIMMGRNFAPGQETSRFISIVKNKGAYGPRVDPKLREGKSECIIDAEIARFKEP